MRIAGKEALIRVLSVISPSAMGTFMSERMNTLLFSSCPDWAKSCKLSTDSFMFILSNRRRGLLGCHHCCGGIEHAHRKATLIVIPGRHLDQLTRHTRQQTNDTTGC